MTEELKYALKLLGMSLEELRVKMILDIDIEKNNLNTTTIYTDGACPDNGNAKEASIGIFYGDNDDRNISSKMTLDNPTNNRAELFAILIALENSSGSLEICSDSQYAISCLTKWMKKWKQNNWKTANGFPVKNKDILCEIDKHLEKRSITFRHVSNYDHKKPKDKRNKDHYGNYMADKLANDALS